MTGSSRTKKEHQTHSKFGLINKDKLLSSATLRNTKQLFGTVSEVVEASEPRVDIQYVLHRKNKLPSKTHHKSQESLLSLFKVMLTLNKSKVAGDQDCATPRHV